MNQPEIKKFLSQYSQGHYSEEEHSRFIDWLKTAPMPEIERIAEEYSKIAEGKPETADSSSRIIEQIESALNRREATKLKPLPGNTKFFLIRRIGAAAAVALLVAGLLGYWWYNKGPLQNNSPARITSAVQDVQAPRGTKARIMLGSGQVIHLDSAASGVLSKQGSINIVKTGQGGVSYLPSSGRLAADQAVYNTLVNPKGSDVVSLTLSDGSKVWLNAASSLRYPVIFGGNERKVEITGEAYFEVAQNATKKFVVVADGVVTEVMGTHFNVNAYQDESRTVITLLEGAVRVSESGSSIVLRPGQQAIAQQGVRMVENADLESAMAWKNGEFIMRSADVGGIMRQVSRWYNVDVSYEAGIPAGTISGEVSRSLNLSEILEVLRYSGVQVKLEDRKVIVMP